MNTKRMRGRYYRSSNNGGARHQNGQVPFNRNHVFESNGPNGRIRGTAQQLHEKYLQQGRDALSSGDRVTAESFFQYAEHYSRIVNMISQSNQQRHRPNNFQETTVVAESDKETEEQSEDAEVVEVKINELEAEPSVPQKIEAENSVPVRTTRRGRPPRALSAGKKKVIEENN